MRHYYSEVGRRHIGVFCTMNHQPLVSFIIPCYNVEPFLSDCLDSIQKQEEDTWEAIVVDDGSTDDSGAIADHYAANDYRVIVVHQTNQGVSVARNKGLELASGRWIWFIDSDDFISDDALSKLYTAIKSNDCDTIFFGLCHQYDVFEREGKIETLTSLEKDIFLELVYCYTNPAMLFSNAIIQQNQLRFTPGIKMAEDLEFQYKYLLFCQRPISISDCLYVYRHREESATANAHTHSNNMYGCMRVARNLLEFVKQWDRSERMWLSLRIRGLLKSGLQSGEHLDQAERSYLQNEIREIVRGFKSIGYTRVKDCTIALACMSLELYYFGLRLFYKVKRTRS